MVGLGRVLQRHAVRYDGLGNQDPGPHMLDQARKQPLDRGLVGARVMPLFTILPIGTMFPVGP